MKLNSQIIRYIRLHKFSDADWDRVLMYCYEHSVKGAHRNVRAGRKSTYEEFIGWLEFGFAVGDVAVYDERLCMVGDSYPDKTFVIGRFDGSRLIVDKILVDTDKLTAAEKEAAEGFVNRCRMAGFQVNYGLGLLTKGNTPKKWDKVRFSDKGGNGYVGILKDFDGVSGDCTFAFLVSGGKVLQNQIFNILSIDVDSAKSNDIKSMQNALELHGLKWNQKSKCLELDCKKGELGQTYWYVSDVFTIRNGIEKNNAIDKMRRKNGNYFLNHTDAIEYLMEILAVRQNMIKNK